MNAVPMSNGSHTVVPGCQLVTM